MEDIQKALNLLKRPALFERSGEAFWDDEHISLQMLKAHLDQSNGAASYPLATVDECVQWLSGLIPAGGAVLDLGCGPGLYDARLSKRGYRVTGVDISRRSLRYAREHDEKGRYLCQNYLSLDAEDGYDAALMISCDMGVLAPCQRRTLLEKTRAALRGGGLFVLDLFTPRLLEGQKDYQTWEACPNGGFWSAQPHIVLKGRYLYEGAVEVERYAVVTGDGIKDYMNWNACLSPEQLGAEAAGLFELESVWGDVCGAPLATDAACFCAVLRAV